MLNYEIILKDAANVPQGVDLREEVAKVVSFQKEKMENGQWTFQWNDKPQKVRDIVHRSKLSKYLVCYRAYSQASAQWRMCHSSWIIAVHRFRRANFCSL
jgi:hypothetical protein